MESPIFAAHVLTLPEIKTVENEIVPLATRTGGRKWLGRIGHTTMTTGDSNVDRGLIYKGERETA